VACWFAGQYRGRTAPSARRSRGSRRSWRSRGASDEWYPSEGVGQSSPHRYARPMLRPESWTKPAGVSPARGGTGSPGSRPRFVIERWRAERGVESLFAEGASVRAAASSESCSLVRITTGEPSRSFHGEGHVRRYWWSGVSAVGSSRGRGSGTYTGFGHGTGETRLRTPCVRQETGRISQW
jgi:hypothetical protein